MSTPPNPPTPEPMNERHVRAIQREAINSLREWATDWGLGDEASIEHLVRSINSGRWDRQMYDATMLEYNAFVANALAQSRPRPNAAVEESIEVEIIVEADVREVPEMEEPDMAASRRATAEDLRLRPGQTTTNGGVLMDDNSEMTEEQRAERRRGIAETTDMLNLHI